MLFSLAIIFLALITALLPLYVRYIPKIIPEVKVHPASVWLPITAGVLMVLSTYLPNIHISSDTSTFQQHFVGGGMYSACLYLYAKRLFRWRVTLLTDLILLFAWISAFGVANKLGEFALLKLGLANIYTGDAYWDLLANTLGGFIGYAMLITFSRAVRGAKN